MKKLVFATNNLHKLEEVTNLLADYNIEILSLKGINCFDEIEETGDSLEENAMIKAKHVKNNYGYDCFGDDTALEVDALDGAPGVHSARYAGLNHDDGANREKLLKAMETKENRRAQFRTAIALILDGKEYYFDGAVSGIITHKARDNTGFGYDPIFQPDGYSETFAELGMDVKNKISHRALAIQKLSDFLKSIS